jgi:hypothetical protein
VSGVSDRAVPSRLSRRIASPSSPDGSSVEIARDWFTSDALMAWWCRAVEVLGWPQGLMEFEEHLRGTDPVRKTPQSPKETRSLSDSTDSMISQ